jgi:HEPN domain-containing protein
MTETSKISASQWRLAARWFERADGDMRIARAIMMHEAETIWGAALHCQQAVEKIAKGLLIAFGQRPPQTHNIEVLAGLVRQHHPVLGEQIDALADLTSWYFVARYPSGMEESLPVAAEINSAIERLQFLRSQIESLAPKPGE